MNRMSMRCYSVQACCLDIFENSKNFLRENVSKQHLWKIAPHFYLTVVCIYIKFTTQDFTQVNYDSFFATRTSTLYSTLIEVFPIKKLTTNCRKYDVKTD